MHLVVVGFNISAAVLELTRDVQQSDHCYSSSRATADLEASQLLIALECQGSGKPVFGTGNLTGLRRD